MFSNGETRQNVLNMMHRWSFTAKISSFPRRQRGQEWYMTPPSLLGKGTKSWSKWLLDSMLWETNGTHSWRQPCDKLSRAPMHDINALVVLLMLVGYLSLSIIMVVGNHLKLNACALTIFQQECCGVRLTLSRIVQWHINMTSYPEPLCGSILWSYWCW